MTDTTAAKRITSQAQNAYNRKDYQGAAHLFRQAADSYLASGELLTAAEMLNNCCVALLQAENYQEALDCVLGTDETFARAGDLRRQAMALGNRAAALEGLKKFKEAEEYYQRSADLFRELHDTESYAAVMQSLSRVQIRQGHQLEALASMQSGMNQLKKPSITQRLVKKILRLPLDYLTRQS